VKLRKPSGFFFRRFYPSLLSKVDYKNIERASKDLKDKKIKNA
jgi:hypothetical protein